MPIFQDDIGGGRSTTPPSDSDFESRSPPEAESMRRKVSEESIRTELCEGPISDSLPDHETSASHDIEIEISHGPSQAVSDRAELIERLKRGESPTWLPNRHVRVRNSPLESAICQYFERSASFTNCRTSQLESIMHDYDSRTLARRPIADSTRSPPLLPSADIKESSRSSNIADNEILQAGLSIERPRSALHSGDFTQDRPEAPQSFSHQSVIETGQPYNLSPPAWLSKSPPLLRNLTPFQLDTRLSSASRPILDPQTPSVAASLSSSFSSTFIFKAPTSPLVQSESNDEHEYSSTMVPIDITASSPTNNRRHTFQASNSGHSMAHMATPSPFDRSLPHLRRDNSYPYQAHQPRRSISSTQGMSLSDLSPQTPGFLQSRRPSFNSDSSPLQIASMVGSYEESILRGRMSTSPSRPLDFLAQIGVLGLGKCKSSLRCPAHVTLPFPAVFYSYSTTNYGRGVNSEDGPSPYVGQVDLENGLPNPDEVVHDPKRRRPKIASDRKSIAELDVFDPSGAPNLSERDIRRAQKQKRRSTSPRAPPGGSYRIPEKGQLQIIIKNPNKTAVKLFLVPYDLAGMEPGTKTFIRQRSYSAGPIINSPLSSSPQTKITEASNDRPTLRYLVHLHICCPSTGRFYLYKSIRVVFANRVPDGKEKLRNEIQLPEPRFSVYKPGRESNHGSSHGSIAGSSLSAEKAFRRRSSGFPLGPSHRAFDVMDGIAQSLHASIASNAPYQLSTNFNTIPVEPIPFSLFQRKHVLKDEEAQIQSPTSSKSSRASISQDSALSESWVSASSSSFGGYDKLSKGDVGYGGNAFNRMHNGQQPAAEGLLAKKLRCLGVGKVGQGSSTESM